MCGIIGYVGKKSVLPILQQGLKRLEYRGYDSSGVAILENGRFKVVKQPGKVDKLNAMLNTQHLTGNLGLGHTRWATHGGVNEANAHPHWDCQRKIFVVHNGIIENYKSLREELKKRGHEFSSQTDTEVIAHLIEESYAGNLEAAVIEILPRLKGTYAFVAACESEPGKLVGARLLSPLILGLSDDGYFLASDATALIDETRVVVYLDDGDLVVAEKNGFKILDFQGQPKDKPSLEIKWDFTSADKQGYPHFMLKEINEQPEVIKRNIARYVTSGRIELGIEDSFLKQARHLWLVACGTAYHASLVAEYLVERWAKIPVTVDTSSEFRYRDVVMEEDTLFICVSQSGETADTLAAMRLAKEMGMRTLAIINVEGSTIAREADAVIYTNAGPEIGVASTKAYIAQLFILQLLGLKIGLVKNIIDEQYYNHYLEELYKAPLYLESMLANSRRIREIAEELWMKNNFLYLARGMNYPNALEGALKLKEISYIHAEGYPGGEMKHGPIALIEKELPVVAILPQGRVRDKMFSNILEVKAREGKIVGIYTSGDDEVKDVCDFGIELPPVCEELSTLIVPIPLQLLAYYIAVNRGCDVDQPRNLAKSVTVE